MTAYTFDAGALSLLLAGDERVKPIIKEVSSGKSATHSNTVNLAELFYKTGEQLGLETAETWHLRIVNSTMKLQHPDPDLSREAGLLKIKYRRRLSLADCFALAQAVKLNATLVTTDRDFQGIKEAQIKLLPV